MKDLFNLLGEAAGRTLVVAISVWWGIKEWWVPLLAAPIVWQIWDFSVGRGRRIDNAIMMLIADGLTFAIWLAYMAYSVLSFGMNVGHWYGWAIGAFVGVAVVQLFGLMWPHRWHVEAVDRRFLRSREEIW